MGDVGSDILIPLDAVDAGERRAALYVCSRAVDVADARLLLDALGLRGLT